MFSAEAEKEFEEFRKEGATAGIPFSYKVRRHVSKGTTSK